MSFINLDIKNHIPQEDYEQIQKYKKGEISVEEINQRDLVLVEAAKNGCLKSRDILFFKHLPLIKYTLNKYFLSRTDYEDALQQSFEWCCITIKNYRTGLVQKNESFTNLLRRNIDNFLINHLKREDTRYGETSYLDELEPNIQERYLSRNDEAFK